MIKNISKEDITRLTQPCKNRNLLLINNNDGSVLINNKLFGTMRDCEDYLIIISRIN